MTASVPVLFDLIDQLVADLRANTAWTIDDGPTTSGDTPTTYIVVGADGDGTAGEALQGWHSLGLQPERDENGLLECLIVSRSGDSDVSSLRAICKTALADLVAQAQQTSVGRAIEMHLDKATIRQALTADGAEVTVTAQLAYTALLTDWP